MYSIRYAGKAYMMYCMLKMKGGRTRSRQDGERQDMRGGKGMRGRQDRKDGCRVGRMHDRKDA